MMLQIKYRQIRTVTLISTLSLISIACCCCWVWGNLPLYDSDLVAGYEFVAMDSKEQAMIHHPKHKNIDPMVFAFGYNKDFIIAKQHPNTDGFHADKSITNWFIIRVATGELFGPLSETEYIELRKRLEVPDTLTFTSQIDP
jgi:hypothetical protein